MKNLTNKNKIGISGANGFIGSYLKKYFTNNGYQVFSYIRNPDSNINERHLDLTNIEDFEINDDLDFFIHTAFVKENDKKKSIEINENSSLYLKQICDSNNIKFIFLSSFSSMKNALSAYGKSKYRIENLLDTDKDLILRLGLVLGNGGLYNNISTLIKKNKFIPLIGNGNQHIQTIGILQLSKIIEKLINENRSGRYNLAEKDGVKMKYFYREISKINMRKTIFIPIPYFISDIAFFFIDLFNIKIGINKENYLGLKSMRKEENINTKNIGIDVYNYKINIMNVNN